MSLKELFQKTMEEFKELNRPGFFKNPMIYHEWLAQTYFFVRHSTALLGYALPHLKEDDLRHHFEKHLGEETRHDLVALKDLQRMGREISEFQESYITQAFYQSQYYQIQFKGGTSLLGYILFLEGIAVYWGKDVYEVLKDCHAGVNFARVHVQEDPEHLEGALKTIESLKPEEQKIILDNFLFARQMYETILMEVIRNNSMLKVA